MKSKVIGALTVAIAAGISAPAWAAWDKITNLDVGYHADRDVASPNFGGPVERLQFTARGTDIQCKYVRARFDNGTTADLFSGRLRQNSAQSVDLPGTRRNIRALVTNCHGFQKGGSSIDVYADIGSYRDTWMKSPDWARVWARIFNWGTSAGSSFDNAVNFWVPITTLRFNGRNDTDAQGTGWGGKSITAIGIKPTNDGIVCRSISVAFANGRTADLTNRVQIAPGTTKRFDLPGQDRNVSRLNARCHSVHGGPVTVQVYGNK